MTKKSCFLGFGALALLFGMTLTSCKADEDEAVAELWQGTLAPAPYAADAACYTIEDSENASFKTIELTGSGLYFVTPADYGYNPWYAPSRFRKGTQKRDWTAGSQIISGEFTRDADGYYDLRGFGKLKWNAADNTLDIKMEEGTEYVWSVQKNPVIEDSSLNQRLCRTWKFTDVRIEFCDAGGKVLSRGDLNPDQVQDEYIEYFTFTRSGRLYRMDDGEWEPATWTWANRALQVLSLVSDDPDDGETSCQIIFENEYMTIMNPTYCYDADEAYDDFGGLGLEIPADTRIVREFLKCKPYSPSK